MPNEIRELQKIVPFSTNGDGATADVIGSYAVLRWLGAAGQHAPGYW